MMRLDEYPVAGGGRYLSAKGALLGLLAVVASMGAVYLGGVLTLLVMAWATDGGAWHLNAHARSVMVLGLLATLAAAALASLEPPHTTH
jgi:hypothetical protein